jgi:hypothetical protein
MVSIVLFLLTLFVLICMAAPIPTPRVAPTGTRLEDGHPTFVTFSLDTNVEIWEIEVKPPGLDGGDAINTTTMHNVAVRTFGLRALYTMTETTITAAYDPIAYDSLRSMINREQTLTVTFPDGSTLAFFGGMTKFDPTGIKEGEMPTATMTIVPTDKDSTGAEQAPVLTNVAGT